MAEESEHPTSPTLDTPEGIVKSAREFSGALTLDLTDDEIQTCLRIVVEIKRRYEEIFRRKFNDPNTFTLDNALSELTKMEDEIKTRLAESVNILATVDTVPILEGKPPVIEYIGKLPGDALYSYGLDHEKKAWQVRQATARGEDFHGQKG